MVLYSLNGLMSDITTALRAIERGEKTVEDDLLPLVYEELRRLAAARMAQQGIGQTLQPTALVHEAWLQLSASGPRSWQNRAHFFGAAADAMRQILIDNARRKSALKRGGDRKRVDIELLEISEATPDEHILLINEALERLEVEDPGKARIVHLKFFGGLTNEEVAENLGISLRTVIRQWLLAKVKMFQWLRSKN